MKSIFWIVLQKLLFAKIYTTEDLVKAERSIFQYKMLPKSANPHKFYVTVLGAINGILPKYFNRVLVAHLDDNNRIFKLSIDRKWW